MSQSTFTRPAPGVVLWHGDCMEVLARAPDNSIDSIVTDPPYGLGFMGRAWDNLPPGLPWARECLRVLKPGGHLLAFGGTRTWHRLAVAVEDAGFEVRDSIAWLYGSGFPKSLDVSKAIDKAGGASPAAHQWRGWGTALKPAFEPIVVARKPLAGTVAGNVLAHGTGALNIDGCRVGDGSGSQGARSLDEASAATRYTERGGTNFAATPGPRGGSPAGRWPTNVVLDGDAAAQLDAQSGTLTSGKMQPTHTTAGVNGRGTYGKDAAGGFTTMETYGDSGGASRFFPTFRYQAKAPTRERPSYIDENGGKVAHETVKPLELMRWLVRLATPPGGRVLDPFAGSGTTMEAAILEGMKVVGIEREAKYLPLIEARILRAQETLEAAA